jgi:hypothetical protein
MTRSSAAQATSADRSKPRNPEVAATITPGSVEAARR